MGLRAGLNLDLDLLAIFLKTQTTLFGFSGKYAEKVGVGKDAR